MPGVMRVIVSDVTDINGFDDANIVESSLE